MFGFVVKGRFITRVMHKGPVYVVVLMFTATVVGATYRYAYNIAIAFRALANSTVIPN